jgi:hypothetical protein
MKTFTITEAKILYDFLSKNLDSVGGLDIPFNKRDYYNTKIKPLILRYRMYGTKYVDILRIAKTKLKEKKLKELMEL